MWTQTETIACKVEVISFQWFTSVNVKRTLHWRKNVHSCFRLAVNGPNTFMKNKLWSVSDGTERINSDARLHFQGNLWLSAEELLCNITDYHIALQLRRKGAICVQIVERLTQTAGRNSLGFSFCRTTTTLLSLALIVNYSNKLLFIY